MKAMPITKRPCAGAVGLMSKLWRLPVIARLGLAYGVITEDDIAASAAMVIEPSCLAMHSAGTEN